MKKNISDRTIEKTRTVNCSIDAVWWKWTTHEGLLTFFGEDNKVNLEIGGEYEIYFLMENPPGTRGGEGNRIISYLPRRMLSFTWNAPPQYPEIREHEHKTWVVIEFTSETNKKTHVRLIHLGWLKGGKWDQVFDYFDKAWDIVLDWLEKSCRS